MNVSMESLAGFFTGAGITLLVFYIYYRRGKKKRRFDERYERIHMLARTYSWSLTLIALTFTWLALLLLKGPGLAFYITLSMYALLLLSYFISAFIVSKKV